MAELGFDNQLRLVVRSLHGEQCQTKTHTVAASSVAVVVVDLWDTHHCASMRERQIGLVPPVDAFLTAARNLGLQVVFAPSEVTSFYAEAAVRKRILALPKVPAPEPDPTYNPPRPPHSRWSKCGCAAAQPCAKDWQAYRKRPKSRQHPGIQIHACDWLVDGDVTEELVAVCAATGVQWLLYVGAATNMCVFNRAVGIKAMTALGFRCVVIRELTAGLVGRPFAPLTPEQITEAGISHIERYAAGSVSVACCV